MKKETKEAIQYGSAIFMLALGAGLAIAGFIISGGAIHDSVLWLFAQCLIYAGSVFGVSIMVTEKFNHLQDKLLKQQRDKEGGKT